MLLQFEPTLVKGLFLKRYKRFLTDVQWPDGTIEIAHCANSGSMRSCTEPNVDAYLQKSLNPNRKLAYTLELLDLSDGLACLNTQRANQLVGLLLKSRSNTETQHPKTDPHFSLPVQEFLHTHFEAWPGTFSEFAVSPKTRFDFCLGPDPLKKPQLATEKPLCLIEVKSVSLLENNSYMFPDAVTTRGQKHAHELAEFAAQGHTTWLFFVLMRGGKNPNPSFALAEHIDPDYAQAVRKAQKAGVNIALIQTHITTTGIDVTHIRKCSPL